MWKITCIGNGFLHLIWATDNIQYAICPDWPGKQISINSLKKLYRSEIRYIRMLGTDSELDWSMNKNGLTIKTPEKRPCNHAYVFKIERN